MKPRSYGCQQNRGQAVTEMALAVPIMIICLFGIVEFGRLLFAWVTVQQAARVAARAAITGQGEQDNTRLSLIINKAHEVADNLPGSANVTVRSWPDVAASGPGRNDDPGRPCELIEVEVQYVYQPVIPVIGHLMPNSGQISLVASDRKLNEPWIPCP